MSLTGKLEMSESHLPACGFTLLICCIWLICGGCSEHRFETVGLVPPSSVVVIDPTVLTAMVPFGMSVTHRLLLQSRYKSKLTSLVTASSCGCTSAELDKDSLDPGEITTLNCVYDGGTVAKSQHVGVRVFSPEFPTSSFVIDLKFRVASDCSDLRISATPTTIFVDEMWHPELTQSYKLELAFGDKVPRNSIEISTSNDFIRADLQGSSLTIAMESPSVGRINEYVVLSFPHERNTYSLKIPIKGKTRPQIRVAPQVINFGKVARGQDMVGEVQLEATASNMDKPTVEVQGNWKLQTLTRISNRVWSVRVCLKELPEDSICYGQILIKGNWQGEDIKIPLTGDFAKE